MKPDGHDPKKKRKSAMTPYIPENFHFRSAEFFPPVQHDLLVRRFGETGIWQFWPGHILWTAQRLRERYGRIEINTWVWGGVHIYRGYRPPSCGIGAEWSFHKNFQAVDMWFTDTHNDFVREEIVRDPDCEDFRHITCVETGVSHLHIDFRNHDKQRHGLLIVSPKGK